MGLWAQNQNRAIRVFQKLRNQDRAAANEAFGKGISVIAAFQKNDFWRVT